MKLIDKDYCLNCGRPVKVMAFRKEGYCSGACAKVIANGRPDLRQAVADAWAREEADIIAFEKRQKKLAKKGKNRG